MRHFTDQEIEEAVKGAPKFIQDEISRGEDTATIIVELGRQFNLHIDVIGMIAELNRNMLLGLTNPEEFLKELIAAKIPENDARQIITEINQKIFIPLREQMKGGVRQQPTKPPAPVNANVPSYASPAPKIPEGSFAPPPQSPTYFHLENKIPLVTGLPKGAFTRPAQPPRPVNQVPLDQKPADSSKLLEDHEEPHIEFHGTPSAGTAETPLRQALRTVLPPANFPGAIVHPPLTPQPSIVPPPPTPAKPVPPVAPTLPRPAASVASTPPKPYSSDPYREPID